MKSHQQSLIAKRHSDRLLKFRFRHQWHIHAIVYPGRTGIYHTVRILSELYNPSAILFGRCKMQCRQLGYSMAYRVIESALRNLASGHMHDRNTHYDCCRSDSQHLITVAKQQDHVRFKSGKRTGCRDHACTHGFCRITAVGCVSRHRRYCIDSKAIGFYLGQCIAVALIQMHVCGQNRQCDIAPGAQLACYRRQQSPVSTS